MGVLLINDNRGRNARKEGTDAGARQILEICKEYRRDLTQEA